MFSSKSPTTTDLASGVTIISKGCSFDGRLFCRGVSRIGGKITGEINAEGTLIIEKDAQIIADIQAQVLVIQGQVKGNIVAKSKVELVSSSHMEGHITTPSILVEEGTTLNASISMGTAPLKSEPRKGPEHIRVAATAAQTPPAQAAQEEISARELGKIQVLRELSERQQERKKRSEDKAFRQSQTSPAQAAQAE